MAPITTSHSSARRAIADLAQLPEGARLQLAGRILRRGADGHSLLLVDSSGAVQVELEGRVEYTEDPGAAARPPEAGDIVQVSGVRRGQTVRADAVRILTSHRRERPFPSPGGEYYRLHAGAAPRAHQLELRSRCLRAVRGFFDERGFVEVQTPCRVRAPGLEPHLTAVASGSRFLITSPEYHMKRLLAGGLERIYNLGPCWRDDECGPRHLGEFCMLEWYRAYCTLQQLMEETEQLLAQVAREILGSTSLRYQGQALSLEPPFERVSVRQAFLQYAGVDLGGVLDAPQLRTRVDAAGLGPVDAGAPFEETASRILVERVEPALAARPHPVLLHGFPAPLAALSRLDDEDPTVAQRFELYAGGLELANAFGELTDPREQARRLEQDQQQRAAAGREVYPVDHQFLGALREGMPPSAGIALGVDRLVMLLCDAAHIREVVAFAPDEI